MRSVTPPPPHQMAQWSLQGRTSRQGRSGHGKHALPPAWHPHVTTLHPGADAPGSPVTLRVSVSPMRIDLGGTSQNEAERSDGRGSKGLRLEEKGMTAARRGHGTPRSFSSSGASPRHDNSVVSLNHPTAAGPGRPAASRSAGTSDRLPEPERRRLRARAARCPSSGSSGSVPAGWRRRRQSAPTRRTR